MQLLSHFVLTGYDKRECAVQHFDTCWHVSL
jgi:hypothetical protein